MGKERTIRVEFKVGLTALAGGPGPSGRVASTGSPCKSKGHMSWARRACQARRHVREFPSPPLVYTLPMERQGVHTEEVGNVGPATEWWRPTRFPRLRALCPWELGTGWAGGLSWAMGSDSKGRGDPGSDGNLPCLFYVK